MMPGSSAGMKVLVTGANGLLGTALVPHLKGRGCDVVGLARSGKCDLHADLVDASQSFAALDDARPQVIVNLAALTDVDACERDPQLAFLANVRIVENLARWIRGAGGTHLVQISTDQVYGGEGPHVEDTVRLWNYYGFSKYAGELAAAQVSSTVLRTNFFGPSRSLGRSSLSDWVVQSLREAKPITVFEDVRFSPLSIASLVSMIALVVQKPRTGVYNLGARDGMSKADFAFALARRLRLSTTGMTRGPLEAAKLVAHRPKDMRLDSGRFETAYGVRLPSLAQEIDSMKAAYT
jgi:dTDP-4-dehydrorhamnose reductase